MINFCLTCEAEGSIERKEIGIKIGKKEFPAVTEVCNKCGSYALTPELRHKIDQWGSEFDSNFIEYQPVFCEAAHDFLDDTARSKGLNKTQLIKILMAFYLNKAITDSSLGKMKEFLKTQESASNMMVGEKSKIPVAVRYSAYKKIEHFCEVWGTRPAKVIEDAVHFGIGLLSYGNEAPLRKIAESLREYVEDHAMAA